MADIPHLALPFRYEGGRPVVNEQDSIDDVSACVEAALRTRVGQRDEYPEFGTPDLTFSQLPTSLDPIVDAVVEREPRARILAEEDPDAVYDAVARVRLTLTTED